MRLRNSDEWLKGSLRSAIAGLGPWGRYGPFGPRIRTFVPDCRPAAVHHTRVMASMMLRCAARTCRLLIARRLHLHRHHVGDTCTLPDGRRFVVFRESSCDGPAPVAPVTLAVWFHLRGVPAGARVRRYVFERESMLNTVLYAGFEGYLVKLWLVDPSTSDYAGLYAWASADEAEAYGRYITAVLRPLSRPGSVGYEVLPAVSLDEYLGRAAVPPASASATTDTAARATGNVVAPASPPTAAGATTKPR
jgi:hypothetical protein